VTFGAIRVTGCWYSAWDCQFGTGMSLDNFYAEGRAVTDPAHTSGRAVYMTKPSVNDGTSGTVARIGQFNIHLFRTNQHLIEIDRIAGLSIDAMHTENNMSVGANKKMVKLERASVHVENWQFLHHGFNAGGFGLVELGNSGPIGADGAGASTFGGDSVFSYGVLNCRGMNNPSVDPAWSPIGVSNATGYKPFHRTAGATGNYKVKMGEYVYTIYGGQDGTVEKALTRALIGQSDLGIDFVPTVPVDNFVKNGDFGTWAAASGSSTGGTEVEIATGWYAVATGSATLRATQVAEVYGQDDSHVIRFENLTTSGTACRLIHKVTDVRALVGARCVLSFEGKAATAGRALEDITFTLRVGTGGSGVNLFDRIILGSDARAQFTTDWTRFEFAFDAEPASSIVALGPDANFELAFRIAGTGGTRESDVHLRKVQVTKGYTAKPFYRRVRS
jgi:hypothetical protein